MQNGKRFFFPRDLPSQLDMAVLIGEENVVLSLLLLLPLVVLPLILVRRSTKNQEEASKPKLPPGPPRLPIIGNLHQLGENLHRQLHQLSGKYGPIMRLQLGCLSTVVVSSAEVATQVLKTHDQLLCGRSSFKVGSRLSYNHSDVALSSYSANWRELRKITVVHLLSTKMMERFRPMREEEIERMTNSITCLSSLSEPVNLTKLLHSFTTNIVCRIAFGKAFHHSKEPTARDIAFLKLHEETEALFSSFCAADYFPWVGSWVDMISGQRARLEKIFAKLDVFYENVIAEHQDPAWTDREEDIVDLLLHLQKEGNHWITRENVKGVVMNLLLAGTNTTASTLEYAMAELMRKPGAMSRAQEEVRRQVGSKGKVDEDDVSQLSYLKMVVKETLRLHPSLPILIPREAMDHVKIHGYDILPGTRVMVNVCAVARDSNYWTDPDEFIPERFIPGAASAAIDFKGHDFQFLPFGAGRRICPGHPFATTAMELALANLIYAFNWELPDDMKEKGVDMDEVSGLSAHLKNNLLLHATRYQCTQAF